MNRLTERLSNGQAAVAGCGSNCEYDYRYCDSENGVCPTLDAVYEKLARYEEVEEQGGCIGCKYEDRREDKSPCVKCYHNYTSKWERRLTKTRQDELLKLYPNIRKVNGVIDICPGDLDMYHHCRSKGPSGKGCVECIREYWLQEVEK